MGERGEGGNTPPSRSEIMRRYSAVFDCFSSIRVSTNRGLLLLLVAGFRFSNRHVQVHFGNSSAAEAVLAKELRFPGVPERGGKGGGAL